MLHQLEIWRIIRDNLPNNVWVPLEDIYRIIAEKSVLDGEDFEPEAPNSKIPKWKHSIRNVLQHRKTKGEIERDGDAKYKLVRIR
jgi:hypothetical protein